MTRKDWADSANLIETPNGRFYFAGKVPVELSFVQKDGSAPTEDQLEIAIHCGPGIAGIKTRSWATRDEADAAAQAWVKEG